MLDLRGSGGSIFSVGLFVLVRYIDDAATGDIVVVGTNDTACAHKMPLADTVYNALLVIGARVLCGLVTLDA